jgi:hypothetical protein
MADEDRPAWPQGFDAIEAAVAPALDALVQREQFQGGCVKEEQG